MSSDVGPRIIQKAQELGALKAGIASTEALRDSPSHSILRRFGTIIDGVYSFAETKDLHEIRWPPSAASALVIALSHPQDKPELDWSDASGNTPGNRELQGIISYLCVWVERVLDIRAYEMPYWVEEGGIYLKDTAVLAGLGCIGKNNLLITPDVGPRVRLRALLLDAELAPTGPSSFDPCDRCEEYCRRACPQNAFEASILTSAETGGAALPGRDGRFSRARCSAQMDMDLQASQIVPNEGFLSETRGPALATAVGSPTEQGIRWCRRCELACPVGH